MEARWLRQAELLLLLLPVPYRYRIFTDIFPDLKECLFWYAHKWVHINRSKTNNNKYYSIKLLIKFKCRPADQDLYHVDNIGRHEYLSFLNNYGKESADSDRTFSNINKYHVQLPPFV